MSVALNFREASAPSRTALSVKKNGYVNFIVSFDATEATQFVALKATSPYTFTPSMLAELVAWARNSRTQSKSPVRNRVLMSERPGIFSLGGDLAFFRDCIKRCDPKSLTDYALTAVDAIWESISAGGPDDVISIALVQGEAQGGGFEAALASHVLIAERGTAFGFPEGLFGLFPGMGASALLTARGSADLAGRLIGSARRYTAEELYSVGVVDFLAEPGFGLNALRSVCNDVDRERLLSLRARFGDIDKRHLIENVFDWVELAMSLSAKHLRTMDFLILAQQKLQARRVPPSVRVIQAQAKKQEKMP